MAGPGTPQPPYHGAPQHDDSAPRHGSCGDQVDVNHKASTGRTDSISAIGFAVSDGALQIVALRSSAVPQVARTVAITEVGSDIRLELQLNELLRSLPISPAGVPIGVAFQATTDHDTQTLRWLQHACGRLEIPIATIQPLARCIEHVEVGGNPHPVLHGAIGAAMIASTGPKPTAQIDEPAPAISDRPDITDAPGSTDLSQALVTRIRQLELAVAAIDERSQSADQPFAAHPRDEPSVEPLIASTSAQTALDQRIAELSPAPRPAPETKVEAEAEGEPDAARAAATTAQRAVGPADREQPERGDAVVALLRQLTIERDQADASAAKMADLVRRLDSHRDDADARAEEVERLNALIDETKQRLEDASAGDRDVRRRIVELEVKNERLGEELRTAEDKERRTEARFAQVATRNAKLESKADDIAEYQVEVFRLNARVSILEEKLDGERKKTRAAIAKATQLRHELITTSPRPRNESRSGRRVG